MFFKKKKKVGIAGWWGGKNEGDLYILNVLKRSLGEALDLHIINIPFLVDSKRIGILNKLDFLIVGGGGLFTLNFPTPFDTFNSWGASLQTPLGFLGVGVQEINANASLIFSTIVERSTFFAVRDSGSYDLVRQYSDKVDKIFDLSFLYPRKIETATDSNIIGANLRIWNFDRGRTYDNAAWCDAINNLGQEKIKIPLSFLEDVDDRVAMKDIAARDTRRFDIELYKKIGVMVGMRLHSLIFAVQNGIPPVGISYTPKIERFFDDLGLGEFCLGIGEYNRLHDTVIQAIKDREKIKKLLDKYNDNAHRIVSEYIGNILSIITNT